MDVDNRIGIRNVQRWRLNDGCHGCIKEMDVGACDLLKNWLKIEIVLTLRYEEVGFTLNNDVDTCRDQV